MTDYHLVHYNAISCVQIFFVKYKRFLILSIVLEYKFKVVLLLHYISEVLFTPLLVSDSFNYPSCLVKSMNLQIWCDKLKCSFMCCGNSSTS